MFLVICLGWVARRRNYLAAESTGLLSRLVVDVAFPALVLTQMLRTVDAAALRENWLCPVFGGVLIVVAYVVAAEGVTINEKELCQFIRERMADYKVPRRIIVMPALPRNATGKILKTELRKLPLS